MLIQKAVLALVIAPIAALAQAGTDTPFQVKYVTNLGPASVNITNTGAFGASLRSGVDATIGGALCSNIYVFSPDEQLITCCSCPVTPGGLIHQSVYTGSGSGPALPGESDLISNTLTPSTPNSIVIKLYASQPVGGTCARSAASPGPAAPGMRAWGTTFHTTPSGPAITETRFSPATLSDGELNRMTQLCNFIYANGSGFGVCPSCTLGGLGAARK